MDIGDLIDVIFMLLISSLFLFICISGAVSAIKKRRSFKQCGKSVNAKIIKYDKQNVKKANYTELVHFVTIICTSPNDGKEHTYVLTTNRSKAKRYQRLEETQVYFIPNEQEPFLQEQMKQFKIDSWLGVIVGVFLTLFLLLLMLILIDYFTEVDIAQKLHELFFN